jgi:methionyl-tRNA formyltransferase
MAGDSETGISIMQIERTLDTGPLFAFARHQLSGNETGASLSRTLAEIGSTTLIEVLRDWSDLPKPSPQNHQRATYAHKLTPADSLISWATPAVDIERIVRALSDRSAAYARLGENRIRILKGKVLEGSANPGELVKTSEGFAIGCADGLLLLNTVQLNRGQGKPMSADEAANGHADLFSTGIQYDVVG